MGICESTDLPTMQFIKTKDAFQALRYPEFRAYVTGNTLFTMALLIQEVILAYELYHLTHNPLALGLIGLGEIGGRVAKVAQAFGMHILTWSPNMTTERALAVGATFVSLDDLLKQSHIVSLHLVASPTTKGLLSKEKISLMREEALLVNTSRSTLIDTSALVEALHHDKIGGAAIDVFDQEPLDSQHPLRTTPHTLLTPHLGFVAAPVFQSFVDGVVESLEAWLDGKPTIRPLP